MAVSLQDVRHIAALARLGVDDARAAELAEQLNGILAHMEALARVDTSGVDSVTAVALDEMPLRDDVGNAVPLERPPAAFAPEMRDGFFLVPRLATHDADAGE